MRRRDFVIASLPAAIAGVCALLPRTAWAQASQHMRRVSLLLGLAEDDPETRVRLRAFRSGMRDLGWIEGRNVRIDYRFAGPDLQSINTHVVELIKLTPEVIVANTTPVMAALRPEKTNIPIVFALVNDPVGQGFISNLMRPGGNITGFSFIEPALVGKWINLLGDIKSDLSRVALIFNPGTAPFYDAYIRSFKEAQPQSPVALEAAHVRSVADIEAVIAQLGREPGSGLIVPADAYILSVRGAILKAADQHRLPVVSPYKQFVAEGSLMSYGPDTADIFRRSAAYVDRILKGEPAGNLPVQSPDKFELVINLKTARALGLSVRESLLLLADEVVE